MCYILREEHRLTVFENTVLRRIYGTGREKDGSWRKLHNDELQSLYSSLNIVKVIKSRRIRRAGHVARTGEGRGVYRILLWRTEGNRPMRRSRRRWEDNLREIGNWIRLAQDRLHWRAFVSMVMNLRIP